jgi:glycosyltransferase involved in cell wall biosynthesis
MTRPLRVAILADYAEENWPSMDIVADMLCDALARGGNGAIEPALIRPPFARRFTRLHAATATALNLDRLLNRFIHYPALVRRIRGRFDLFHIIDHSYGHLVHGIPDGRAIVTCHDLDTFRCILEPEAEPRSWPFRAMVRRVLGGLRRAAMISCVSAATRAAVLAHAIAPEARVRTVHNGVNPVYSPEADAGADLEAARLLGPSIPGVPELLHVGGTVARKRIDLLLRVFADLREAFDGVRLIRVGGGLTASQRDLASALHLDGSIVEMPFLDARVLAAIYRRAALVLLPSDAEGFGLPLAEAMACGTPVLASDIAACREVGGDAAAYAPRGDARGWIDAASILLRERLREPGRVRDRRAAALRRANSFSWDEAAAKIRGIYSEMLSSRASTPGECAAGPIQGARGKAL